MSFGVRPIHDGVMMPRTLFLLIPILLTSCGRNTPDAEVVDSGLYDAIVITSGSWLLDRPVEISSVHKLEHQKEVARIPAEDGRYWGFRARLTNPHKDKSAVCRYVIEHPEFTTPLGISSTEEIEEYPLPPGHSETHAFIWYFIEGCEHEFVPGTWTQRLFIDDQEVVHLEFDVFRP